MVGCVGGWDASLWLKGGSIPETEIDGIEYEEDLDSGAGNVDIDVDVDGDSRPVRSTSSIGADLDLGF